MRSSTPESEKLVLGTAGYDSVVGSWEDRAEALVGSRVILVSDDKEEVVV